MARSDQEDGLPPEVAGTALIPNPTIHLTRVAEQNDLDYKLLLRTDNRARADFVKDVAPVFWTLLIQT